MEKNGTPVEKIVPFSVTSFKKRKRLFFFCFFQDYLLGLHFPFFCCEIFLEYVGCYNVSCFYRMSLLFFFLMSLAYTAQLVVDQ